MQFGTATTSNPPNFYYILILRYIYIYIYNMIDLDY